MLVLLLIFMLLIIVLHLNLNNNNKKIGTTAANGRIDVETMVSLKYLSNFWRTLEMPLINREYISFLLGLKNVYFLIIQKQ